VVGRVQLDSGSGPLPKVGGAKTGQGLKKKKSAGDFKATKQQQEKKKKEIPIILVVF
jgi:hypothetical protein